METITEFYGLTNETIRNGDTLAAAVEARWPFVVVRLHDRIDTWQLVGDHYAFSKSIANAEAA